MKNMTGDLRVSIILAVKNIDFIKQLGIGSSGNVLCQW